MIGLIAPLLTAIVLRNPIIALAIAPYILGIKWKNLSLITFYMYLLAIIPTIPRVSIYEWNGLRAGILISTATFLLLDEILGGVNLDRKRLILTAIILVSAVNDYTLILTMISATIYISYTRFKKTAYYLVIWICILASSLYILKGKLPDPTMQTFIIIGLGISFLLLAEKNNVESAEVNLFEKE